MFNIEEKIKTLIIFTTGKLIKNFIIYIDHYKKKF
jgi:hypothetical protein